MADERIANLDSIPAVSIVTQIELEGGVQAQRHLVEKRRAAVDALLGTLEILDFDADCASAYRRIMETVGFSRKKVIGRMIAATALAHDLSLITLNGRDFRDIPELKLEEW